MSERFVPSSGRADRTPPPRSEPAWKKWGKIGAAVGALGLAGAGAAKMEERVAQEEAHRAERMRVMTEAESCEVAQRIAAEVIRTNALRGLHEPAATRRALERVVEAQLTRRNRLNSTNLHQVNEQIELGGSTGPFYEAAIDEARTAHTSSDFARISDALSAFNAGYAYETHNWPLRVALKAENDAYTKYVIQRGLASSPERLSEEGLDLVAGLTLQRDGDADRNAEGIDFLPDNRARLIRHALENDPALQQQFDAFLVRAGRELRERERAAHEEGNNVSAHNFRFMNRELGRIAWSHTLDRIDDDIQAQRLGDMVEVEDRLGSSSRAGARRRAHRQR